MDYKSFKGNIPDLLNAVYLEKKSRNKHFSLRAFARDIGVPPGRLSEIMAGKRNLTLSVAQKFSEAYSLNSDEKKELYMLVKSQTKLRSKKISDRQLIDPQDFAKICHWKYYSLICLVQNSQNGATINDLSERLGLKECEIHEMLLTLKKMNLASHQNDRYFAPKVLTTTTQDVLDKSLHQFQKEMLELHLTRLSEVPTELREAQTIILSFSKSKMKQAKIMIKKCLSSFESKFGAPNDSDVFSLSVQLSPLTSTKAKD